MLFFFKTIKIIPELLFFWYASLVLVITIIMLDYDKKNYRRFLSRG